MSATMFLISFTWEFNCNKNVISKNFKAGWIYSYNFAQNFNTFQQTN